MTLNHVEVAEVKALSGVHVLVDDEGSESEEGVRLK